MACRADATVLLGGPTGSGKSTLARRLHARSPRSGKPFVAVNLATVHEGTIESELFGHERGAFTGADRRRVGRLEEADGGTVFLDEIGDLSPRLQARLLDFLQYRTITPVGSNRSMSLNVRVIAATHRELEKDVRDGRFRQDLFFRLRVIMIRLPALSDRSEEFDGIVHECLESVCGQSGRRIRRLSPETAEALEAYSWPGNIRELRNVLEYAVISARDETIRLSDLPEWFGEGVAGNEDISGEIGAAQVRLTADYRETLSRFERAYLKLALERNRGRVNQTARDIGLSKATLIRRIRAYGLMNAPAVPKESALRV